MAINTINATIQMRNGPERYFDPTQMTVGEWAVSTDAKYVRMCFAPGIVLRMATYESFESDMNRIQAILDECKDVQAAVEEFERLAEIHKNDAAASAATASTKATQAAGSASAAATSETQAAAQAAAAKAFKDAADASQKAAKASETNAKDSEAKAKESETAAAQSAATAAQDSIDAANKANEASASAETAATAAATATAKAGEASDFSDLSESYAVGTEGAVREGDATDNSKYYSEQSKASADESKAYLGKVEQAGDDAVGKINDALNVAKPDFLMDLATGHLLYDGSWFDFLIVDGHLRWEMVA